MCGRFTLQTASRILAEQFGISKVPQLELRYNICPSQSVLVARCNPLKEFAWLEWGFVPAWSKTFDPSKIMINARIETVADKPSFKDAFQHRRCLIIADGFYEWRKEASAKQPYYIQQKEHRAFAMAGIWERWVGHEKDEQGNLQQHDTCAILTTEAQGMMREIHTRMPVILPREKHAQWLDPKNQNERKLLQLLQDSPVTEMTSHTVRKLVNSAQNDSALCIEPYEENLLF